MRIILFQSNAIRHCGRNASPKAEYLGAFLFVIATIPQTLASPAPSVLTVCEALRGIGTYAGKDVVIVGYSGWTFEGIFMHEKCESDDRIMIQGHRWLSMIELTQAEPPAKTTEPFPVEDSVLREKLSHLDDYRSAERKGSEEQGSERGPGRISLAGTWIAAYGRLESPSKLKAPVPPTASNSRNTPGNGFGANGSVPARLLVIRSRPVPPKDK